MTPLTPDETILGLLALQPRHGYDLVACFRRPQALGHVWHLSTSQIYAVLKRLARNGWVTSHTRTTEQAPARIEYAITSAGKEILQAWLYETQPPASVRRIRVEFLSRLYLAQQLGLDTAPIIAQQRASCSRRCDDLASERTTSDDSAASWAIDLQLTQLKAAIAWLDALANTELGAAHKLSGG